MNYQDILSFWFDETDHVLWFKQSNDFDHTIATRFAACHHAVAQGECWQWRDTPEGRLAEIIVLDQFSRNLFRDSAHAFAHDATALTLAQTAIATGDDMQLKPEQRSFVYMPFMHSESAIIHTQAVELFTKLGNTSTLEFEHKHKAIIDRFGRYPHRNALLGRKSSIEEIEFLTEPNSRF